MLFYEFCGTAFVVSAYTLSFFDPLARSIAYFIGFILLFHVTGAHFNPATTLADYLNKKSSGTYTTETDKKNALKLMCMVIFIQMIGSLMGVLITYLLAKFYLPSYRLYPKGGLGGLYTYTDSNYEVGFQYARIFGQEVLQTCLFTLFYLALTQSKDVYTQRSNFLLRGLALVYI